MNIQQKKSLLFLDNSFISTYCKEGHQERWNNAISELNNEFNFKEGDYEFITPSLLLIEVLGIGKRLYSTKDIEVFFNDLTEFTKHSYIPITEKDIDPLIVECYQKLSDYFSKKLSAQIIVDSIDEFLNNPENKYHPHAHALPERLITWLSNMLQSEETFQELIMHLAWNSFFNLKNPLFTPIDKNILQMQMTQAINKRLIAFYVDTRKEYAGYNLIAPSCFIRHCVDTEPSHQEMKSRPQFKQYEFVDPIMTELSCAGWFQNGRRYPVTILTCDQNQKERLRKTIEGINCINERLKALKKDVVELIPGHIIIFEQNSGIIIKIIDVSQYL